jgi:hypothetical protein
MVPFYGVPRPCGAEKSRPLAIAIQDHPSRTKSAIAEFIMTPREAILARDAAKISQPQVIYWRRSETTFTAPTFAADKAPSRSALSFQQQPADQAAATGFRKASSGARSVTT